MPVSEGGGRRQPEVVVRGETGDLPGERVSFKDFCWVPNRLHETGESFPASFLICHSLFPSPDPRALPTPSPVWPTALRA